MRCAGLWPRKDRGEADVQIDSKFMKNKKRKTGEELKEHKRRAKQNKVSSTSTLEPPSLHRAGGVGRVPV
jgi:hypothetical protein